MVLGSCSTACRGPSLYDRLLIRASAGGGAEAGTGAEDQAEARSSRDEGCAGIAAPYPKEAGRPTPLHRNGPRIHPAKPAAVSNGRNHNRSPSPGRRHAVEHDPGTMINAGEGEQAAFGGAASQQKISGESGRSEKDLRGNELRRPAQGGFKDQGCQGRRDRTEDQHHSGGHTQAGPPRRRRKASASRVQTHSATIAARRNHRCRSTGSALIASTPENTSSSRTGSTQTGKAT
jgi:hypothetical protein